MIDVKKDDRGELFEVFKLPNDGQIFCVRVLEHETRGEHYHTRKAEKFCVIDGAATIALRKKGSDKIKEIDVDGKNPQVVDIPINTVHHIYALAGGCVLLVWSNEVFDEKDPDTYKELV